MDREKSYFWRNGLNLRTSASEMAIAPGLLHAHHGEIWVKLPNSAAQWISDTKTTRQPLWTAKPLLDVTSMEPCQPCQPCHLRTTPIVFTSIGTTESSIEKAGVPLEKPIISGIPHSWKPPAQWDLWPQWQAMGFFTARGRPLARGESRGPATRNRWRFHGRCSPLRWCSHEAKNYENLRFWYVLIRQKTMRNHGRWEHWEHPTFHIQHLLLLPAWQKIKPFHVSMVISSNPMNLKPKNWGT